MAIEMLTSWNRIVLGGNDVIQCSKKQVDIDQLPAKGMHLIAQFGDCWSLVPSIHFSI